MIQGGKRIIARLPIFVKNKNGKESFWGLAISTIKFDTLMDATTLLRDAGNKYDFQIAKVYENGDEPAVFISSLETRLENGSDFTFSIPNGYWTISIRPKTGWVNYRQVFFNLLVALIIDLLISYRIFSILKKPIVLQEMVNERTVDLAAANEDLLLTQKKLFHMAHFDNLTGIPNRAMFETKFKEMIVESKGSKEKFALLYIDLDFFKDINDNYGHNIGDEVLKEVASRMHKCVRKYDTVGRIGGDEFAILLGDIKDIEMARKVADKVDAAIKAPFTIHGINLDLSASVGSALYPDNGHNETTLFSYADQSMFEIKESRHNKVKFQPIID